MKKNYTISSYSIIRKNSVVLNSADLYSAAYDGFQEFSTVLYNHFNFGYPKFHKMDNLCKLGFLSVELLLKDKSLNARYSGEEVGIFLMNSSSSIDSDRSHQKTISCKSDYFPSPSVFVYTLPNIVIGELCIRHKFSGEGCFFISEKFNYDFLVPYIEQLMDNDIIKCCISGWVESDGDNYEALVFLVEETGKSETGIAKFDAVGIQSIFSK